MKWPPTDLQVLEEIYRRYYGEFAAFSRDCPERSTKVYVPIDIAAIAKHFKIDGDIIHGRLYYCKRGDRHRNAQPTGLCWRGK